MTDDICGATNRHGEPCQQPAGWGTDHVGKGRCKLHGGNAGAPADNQNASKHGLNADLHHYYRDLPPEQKEFIEKIAATIEDRVRENTGTVDYMDRVLSKQVAIQLHISSKASAYIEKESGLVQDVPARGSTRKEAAPLLEEVRRYDDSIFRNLKKLGVLDDPDSQKADALESWRDFIEKSYDS
ncbi:hypothetical protein NGM10_06655 [Halorussus salilacus]|uniref:HGGxSTG domain-containing protein n=1 Tax=Halorussus salilacus TaxID=2953750 RepID=UPI00209E6880|nr:HGGxSTG domain-containing protein [Halorussus salilacus]USZ69410.1 hypothetical protein NGM10_06655 [Halorussus salilacus]